MTETKEQPNIDEEWKKESADNKAELDSKQQDGEPVWVDFKEVKGFLGHIATTLGAICANIYQTVELIEKQIDIEKNENKGNEVNDDKS